MARIADRVASRIAPLIWLRARHVRTDAMFWATALGVDPETGGDLIDRIYNVYLAVICAGWSFTVWSAVRDAIEQRFGLLGPAQLNAPALALIAAPLATLLVQSCTALRVSPLKLIDADLPFRLAGGFSSRALAAVDAAVPMMAAAIGGFLVAFLIGCGLEGAGAGVRVWSLAATIGLAEAAAIGTGRAVGYARLSMARGAHPAFRRAVGTAGVAAVELALAGAVLTGAVGVGCTRVLRIGLGAPAPLIGPLVAVVLFAGSVAALAWGSARMDIIRAIDENGLYSALFGVRRMLVFDRDAYFDLRRRQKIARRRLRPTIPLAHGAAAPLSRAALTHLRQFEGLPRLALIGVLEVPASVGILARHLPVLVLIAWGWQFMFIVGPAVRELGLAFREDMGVSLIRDHLPFSNARLALIDAIPAALIALALAFATIAAGALGAPGSFSALAPVHAALLVIALALSAAFDGTEIMLRRTRMTSLLGLLAVVLAAGSCSLAGELAVAAGLLALTLLLCGILVRGA